MSLLRLSTRLLLLVLLSAGFNFVRIVLDAISSSETALARRGYILHRWAALAARVLSIDVKIKGAPPAAPFFLTSNHLSYLDIIVFSSIFPCRFVSRGDLAEWPLLGYLSRSFDTIFVDRNRKRDTMRVNSEIGKALVSGSGIVIFPEATTSAGAKVLPFRTSLLEPSARNGFPVSFAAIKYHTESRAYPVDQAVCWWGEMSFLPHFLRLLQIPAIRAEVSFGEGAVTGTERKHLGYALRNEVQELLSGFQEGVA